MSDLSNFSVPWKDADYIAQLDLGYYWHSAQKIISPVVYDVSGIAPHSDLSELTQEQRLKLAGMVFNIFHRKWDKLWAVYEVEYDPTHNYVMEETETIDRDVTRNGSDTGTVNKGNTGTVTDAGTQGGTLTTVTDGETTNTGTSNHAITEGGTINTVTDDDATNTGTQTTAGNSNTLEGIFGFNSNASVGSDTSDNTTNTTRTDNLASTDDKTVTETRNLNNTDNRTDNLASTEDTTVTETRNLTDGNTRTLNTNDLETRNLAHAETESDDSERNMKREGTTGIYTPQQLLTDELELWQWNFFKQVFEDIDSLLCLSVY